MHITQPNTEPVNAFPKFCFTVLWVILTLTLKMALAQNANLNHSVTRLSEEMDTVPSTVSMQNQSLHEK